MSAALVLVGKSDECKMRLRDPRVSEIHCALVRTRTGVWVIDLLSDEGVFINDQRVRASRLDQGARLSIGPFTIRAWYDQVPDEPGTALGLRTTGDPGTISGREAEPAGPRMLGTNRSRAEMLTSQSGFPAFPTDEHGGPATDQLQQVVLMMGQMFGAMHRDHVKLVREELDVIRRLAEEMHALRMSIDKTPPVHRNGLRDARDPRVAVVPYNGVDSRQENSANGVSASGTRTPHEVSLGDWPHAARALSDHAQQFPDNLRENRDPKEMHAIASQFLASYDRERKNRWNNILKILSGAHGGQVAQEGPLVENPV
jgi:hypothetical protein